MTHFAKLDENNTVIEVLRGRQEDDGKEADLCERTGDIYRQTSYNTRAGIHLLNGTPFRKNFAGIGFIYDQNRDAFIEPQPFPSWVLDEFSCTWQPPTPQPDANLDYQWDESSLTWIEVVR